MQKQSAIEIGRNSSNCGTSTRLFLRKEIIYNFSDYRTPHYIVSRTNFKNNGKTKEPIGLPLDGERSLFREIAQTESKWQ